MNQSLYCAKGLEHLEISAHGYFEGIAPFWDELNPLEKRLEAIKRGLDLAEPLWGMRVLDAGSGTGVLLPFVLERIGPGSVVAADVSASMVAQAKKKISDPRVTFWAGDVLSQDFPFSEFDIVLCFDAFPHFGDAKYALSRLWQILRPGGRLLVWHDVGRERLETIHRQAGRPIAHHALIPVLALAELSMGLGFLPTHFSEDDCSYTFLAIAAP